mmetsp:Transcript_37536/g.57578  ORF Transcript_37536/g.57578 Transcript_37536/m.57578 type:complete len:269 (-) Transcript_37536:136-942(-)
MQHHEITVSIFLVERGQINHGCCLVKIFQYHVDGFRVEPSRQIVRNRMLMCQNFANFPLKSRWYQLCVKTGFLVVRCLGSSNPRFSQVFFVELCSDPQQRIHYRIFFDGTVFETLRVHRNKREIEIRQSFYDHPRTNDRRFFFFSSRRRRECIECPSGMDNTVCQGSNHTRYNIGSVVCNQGRYVVVEAFFELVLEKDAIILPLYLHSPGFFPFFFRARYYFIPRLWNVLNGKPIRGGVCVQVPVFLQHGWRSIDLLQCNNGVLYMIC